MLIVSLARNVTSIHDCGEAVNPKRHGGLVSWPACHDSGAGMGFPQGCTYEIDCIYWGIELCNKSPLNDNKKKGVGHMRTSSKNKKKAKP